MEDNIISEAVQFEEMSAIKTTNYVVALPKTNKNKGLAIMLNYNDMGYTTSMVQEFKQFLNYQYIKSFYVPNRYFFKLFNKNIKERIDTTELYNTVRKNKDSTINYMYKRLEQYSGNNILIGMYKYNELFNQYKGRYQGHLLINQYIDMMNNFANNLEGYDKKIMLIDLLSFNIEPNNNNLFISSKSNNPLSYYIGLLQKDINKFKQIPYDILIVYCRYKIKIVPSLVTKESIKDLKAALHKIVVSKDDGFFREGDTNPSDIQTDKDAKEDKKFNIEHDIQRENPGIYDIMNNKVQHNFTGDVSNKEVLDIENDVKTKIGETIDNVIKDEDDIDIDETRQKVEDVLNQDNEFLANLDTLSINKYANVLTNADIKRNKLLKKNQENIRINKTGKSIKEIIENKKVKELIPEEIHIDTLNEDMKKNSFTEFRRKYTEEMYEKDIIAQFNELSNKEYPVFILGIDKKDTSDEFNKKWTYTFKLESGDRVRHTVQVDMPKFIDNDFLFLGANEKNINTQFLLLPIEKIGPDTVKLCSNYNKIIVTRLGNKSTPKIERLKKYLDNNRGVNRADRVYFTKGNNFSSTNDFLTNIEYDELTKDYNNLYININQSNKYNFYFNQNEIRKFDVKEDETKLPVAIKNNKEIIYLDCQKDTIENTDKSLVDFIIDLLSQTKSNFNTEFNNIKVGKKFMYTTADIMRKNIPLVLLISYITGLTMLLKKANINFKFVDKKTKDIDITNKGIIEFNDGYLIYDRYPIKNSLLLDGLSSVPTKNYNYDQFDSTETYLDIFDILYNDRKVLNAFINFNECFIDAKTKDVLIDYQLPTEFVDLLIYANNLLEDNQFIEENHMSHYRIRNNEIPVAILSKQLSIAYSIYRSSIGNKHPKKISLPQDIVLKKCMTEKIIEDHSTLNPALESEKLRAGTFKGPSGLNSERTYTLNKRAYNKSMKGLFAMSSPPSGSIGIVRQMPMDVNVTSTMGYLKVTENPDDLNSSNMFCPSELLTPGTAQHDDGSRVAMVTSQTKHIVPAKNYSPLLIGNGGEKALAQVISNTFAFKAKKEGTVKEIKNEIMVIEYKDGTNDFVDLSKKIAKNGGGGFYITNQLTTTKQVGDKVHTGEVIASNKKFFKQDGEDAIHKCGALTKVAIMSGYYTYEDSAMVTEKLSSDLTTEVTMAKKVKIGKNSNISFIVKKGDTIGVGDPLIIFDESFEDESINKLLNNMSTDVKNQFDLISKIPVKSKYAGIIEDVKVTYTIDKKEFSPSVQKVINEINKENIDKRKLLKQYVDNPLGTNLVLDPIDKVDAKYGKVKGEDVGEGLLIEFYITYQDKLGVADKITFFTALKTEVCKVIPKGQEPYSEFREDEEIGAFISPISVLARMTKSIETQLFGNKFLIELKRKVAEIYFS